MPLAYLTGELVTAGLNESPSEKEGKSPHF